MFTRVTVTYTKLNARTKRRTLIILTTAGLPTLVLIALHIGKVIDLYKNLTFMGIFVLTASVMVFFICELLKSGFYYWMEGNPGLGPLFTKLFAYIEVLCVLAMFVGLFLIGVSIFGGL